MANTFRLDSASYNGRYMYLTLTQTKDIATNTSTINWTLTVTGGSSNYYDTGATTVKINNTQVYYKERVSWSKKVFPAAKGSVSGSLTVAHNNEGKLTIPVSLETAIYTGTLSTVSGNWTLDTIPRAATLLTAPNFTDEENPTITYSNLAGNNVTSLLACITLTGNNPDIAYREISKTGNSYTFNLTDEERAVLRKAVKSGTSRTLKFYLKTVIGSNTFFSKSSEKTFTLVNAFPVIAPTAIDTSERAIELTGNANTIIRGYNSVKVAVNATAQKEATITSYLVSSGAKSVAASEGWLDYVEDNNFIFKAIDNRGNSTTQILTLPMVEYINLTCNLIPSIELTGGTKAAITLDISGNYFNDSFGAQDNTLAIKYRYKTNSGSYGDWIDTTAAITYKNGGYELKEIIADLDYQNTYTVQAIAYDAVFYGGKTSAESAVKAIPVFDWSGSDFNFNVPVSIGGVVLDYIIEQDTKDGWSYRKWNSGRAECWKVMEFSTTINTAFGSLYCGNATARQNYPFTFVAKPMEQVTLQSGNTQAFLYAEAGGYGVNGATASGRYNVFCPSAVTTSEKFYLSFYVCGNWK